MFIAHNKVRMHDTDMAGLLYFARQFRFAHDALEDLYESEGYDFDNVFHKRDFVFVIVHCEADFFAHLKVGDKLEVHVSVEKIGNSSFTMSYNIFKKDDILVGTVKTIHVCLKASDRKKITIPDEFRLVLEKYLQKIES